MIHFLLVQSRSGKPRLAKYYESLASGAQRKIEEDVTKLMATLKGTTSVSVMEYGQTYNLVFRRYAGLFFIVGASREDMVLPHYEFIQLFVETLDLYFGNVCELDIVFKFDKVYAILDELLLAGHVLEIDKNVVVKIARAADQLP
jgi:AP-2 complex subunit sigma-1